VRKHYLKDMVREALSKIIQMKELNDEGKIKEKDPIKKEILIEEQRAKKRKNDHIEVSKSLFSSNLNAGYMIDKYQQLIDSSGIQYAKKTQLPSEKKLEMKHNKLV